jgi:hypothetical protein
VTAPDARPANQTQAPPLDAPGATEPPDERTFSIGQVLTLAVADADANQQFCSLGELYEVTGYMLGDVPMAANLAHAITTRCRPAVLAQYPDLAAAGPPPPAAPDVRVLAWLAEAEARYGPRLVLRPAVPTEPVEEEAPDAPA